MTQSSSEDGEEIQLDDDGMQVVEKQGFCLYSTYSMIGNTFQMEFQKCVKIKKE